MLVGGCWLQGVPCRTKVHVVSLTEATGVRVRWYDDEPKDLFSTWVAHFPHECVSRSSTRSGPPSARIDGSTSLRGSRAQVCKKALKATEQHAGKTPRCFCGDSQPWARSPAQGPSRWAGTAGSREALDGRPPGTATSTREPGFAAYVSSITLPIYPSIYLAACLSIIYLVCLSGPELLPPAGEDRRAPEPCRCPSGRGSPCGAADYPAAC